MAFMEAKAAASEPFSFAVIEKASARALGMFSLMRIDLPHRVIETGAIVFSPAAAKERRRHRSPLPAGETYLRGP